LLTADDGSINQQFSFDGKDIISGTAQSRFGASNNKPTQSQDFGVLKDLEYNGLNGRLSKLATTVDGLTFSQYLSYDSNYGFLSNRTYPGGNTQTILQNNAKGLPNGTLFNNVAMAGIGYDTNWNLANISWSNGASSFFTYDNDQTRLKRVTHTLGSQTLRDWNYKYNPTGTLQTDGEDSYTYDGLNRLTSASIRDFGVGTNSTAGSNRALLQSFNYDAFGNRKALSTLAITNWPAGQAAPSSTPPITTALTGETRDLRSYTMALSEIQAMGNRNRLPASIGGVPTGSYYDAQGNLKEIQRIPGSTPDAMNTLISLKYDALGRITSMFDKSRNSTEIYTYDDQGLRVLVEVYQGQVG
jgi:YD repeat-containing protein